MEIMLRQPNQTEARDWQGSSPLRYIGRVADGIPLDRNADEFFQHLTVTIDSAGVLSYEYYRSEQGSGHWDPPEDNIIVFFMDCQNVEAAKRMHEVIVMDIENMTPDRWVGLGFTKEDVS